MTSKDPTFQYAVKFVCGRADGEVLARGEYLTAVNVHNPTNKDIEFRKKFAIALPRQRPGPVSEFASTRRVRTKHWKSTARTSAKEPASKQISLKDSSSSRVMSNWTWLLCTRRLGRIERSKRCTSSACQHAVGKCCRVPRAST